MIGGVPGIGASAIGGLREGFSTGAATKPSTEAGDSFSALLSRAAGQAVETLQNAERVSVQGMQGQVDVREVVDAVMTAEQSLQAAIAVRDKIVSAYLEVSRMAI